jgi:hypothetical protein
MAQKRRATSLKHVIPSTRENDHTDRPYGVQRPGGYDSASDILGTGRIERPNYLADANA